jgi:hypothetical protein
MGCTSTSGWLEDDRLCTLVMTFCSALSRARRTLGNFAANASPGGSAASSRPVVLIIFGEESCQSKGGSHAPAEFSMKRSRQLSVLILIVLALFLSGAKAEGTKSKNSRANQHQSETDRHPNPIGNQEPQIPLAVWQRTQAALNESIATVKEQAEAAKKQADAYKETWRSPSVLVQIVLTLITGGFLIYAGLQWRLSQRALVIANRAYVNI